MWLFSIFFYLSCDIESYYVFLDIMIKYAQGCEIFGDVIFVVVGMLFLMSFGLDYGLMDDLFV